METTQQTQAEEYTPQKLVFNGMAPVEPRSITIASLDFQSHVYRAAHSRRHTFVIPASDGKIPSYLTVYDSQQWVPSPGGDDGPMQMIPMPTPVDLIANDMIGQWTGGGVGALHRYAPGIMIIAGKTATPSEIKQMQQKQLERCRRIVDEADKAEKTGKGEIMEYHRLALKQLGDERSRVWYKQIEQGTLKKGAITGADIRMESMIDGGQDLMEWYVKYDLKPEEYGDVHIAAMFEKKPELKQKIRFRLGMVTTAK